MNEKYNQEDGRNLLDFLSLPARHGPSVERLVVSSRVVAFGRHILLALRRFAEMERLHFGRFGGGTRRQRRCFEHLLIQRIRLELVPECPNLAKSWTRKYHGIVFSIGPFEKFNLWSNWNTNILLFAIHFSSSDFCSYVCSIESIVSDLNAENLWSW